MNIYFKRNKLIDPYDLNYFLLKFILIDFIIIFILKKHILNHFKKEKGKWKFILKEKNSYTLLIKIYYN